jgi:hypothetical protein
LYWQQQLYVQRLYNEFGVRLQKQLLEMLCQRSSGWAVSDHYWCYLLFVRAEHDTIDSYVGEQQLTGTIVSYLATFSALSLLYALLALCVTVLKDH